MAFVSATGRNKVVDNDGYIADVYGFAPTSSEGFALRTSESLIPNAEDNTNNVIHVNVRPLSNSTNAASYYYTTALATNGVVKATGGKIFKVSGFIVPSTSDGYTHYLQLHNTTAVPADTAVPVFSLPYVAGGSTTPMKFEYEFCNLGKWNDVGICWNLSSTGATKTLSTTATAWIQVSYI